MGSEICLKNVTTNPLPTIGTGEYIQHVQSTFRTRKNKSEKYFEEYNQVDNT